MSEKPEVIDLTKSDESDDDAPTAPYDRESPAEMDREDLPTGDENGHDLYAEMRENVDDRDASGETEKEDGEFSLKAYDLTQKFDREKSFSEVSEGDIVLIDTPLEGGKVGEVTGVEKAWTGTLQMKVETGANQYEVTPYEDDLSEKFVACLSDAGALSEKLLGHLSKTELTETEVGDQVILDIPSCGPTRGTVAHKMKTETQGAQLVVNTGPVAFKLYEHPSPTQKKEQPILVGRVQ